MWTFKLFHPCRDAPVGVEAGATTDFSMRGYQGSRGLHGVWRIHAGCVPAAPGFGTNNDTAPSELRNIVPLFTSTVARPGTLQRMQVHSHHKKPGIHCEPTAGKFFIPGS